MITGRVTVVNFKIKIISVVGFNKTAYRRLLYYALAFNVVRFNRHGYTGIFVGVCPANGEEEAAHLVDCCR